MTRRRGNSSRVGIEIPDEVFAPGRLGYTVFVMVSTSAIPLMMLAALLGFFMPVIEELFVEVNRELSAPTQLLLDMSPYWYLVIPLMALAPVLLILSLQSFFRTGRGERMTWPIAIGVTITGAVIVVGFLVISLILPMISILRNNQ